MNVLFFVLWLPDLNKNNSMYGDLIKEFYKKGDNITVVTPSIIKRTYISKENSINVIRVKSPSIFGVSNLKKGLAFPILIFNYIFAVKKFLNKKHFDIALFHTPPCENAILLNYIKNKYRCFTYLILRDFTWQDAVGFGYFSKNSIICKYYHYLDGKLYYKADSIGCMSSANIDFALKFYPKLKRSKFHILYNFQKLEQIDNIDMRKELNISEDKFIVIYGGNTSIAQKIEHVLILAESCKNIKNIVFLIIGQGCNFERIKSIANRKKLENIIFHDLMSRNKYLSLLIECNVGLIVLNEKLTSPNIPSKTMSYFNAKLPILASIDNVTDYGKLLENINAGLWSYSGDNNNLKNNLMSFYNDRNRCITMGNNGYNFFINNMLPEHAYNIIVDKLKYYGV